MVLAPAEVRLTQLELPMARETKIIEVDREQSVQVIPDTKQGTSPFSSNNRVIIGTGYRGPLLPQRGSRERERALYEYYWNDYNTAFRAAIAGLTKRVMSTPWELTGPDDYVEYFQFILQQADFGHGWESFIGKLILDYSRYDAGAYIELIGMGDPLDALRGPCTGLAILDSRRCWPTGDPAYPVLYYDILGKMHVLHHTRVVRFVDMLDPSEYAYDYGECALSRCISAVVRDIYMNRYIEQRLDDNPPAGMMIYRNITAEQVRAARDKLKQQRNTDHGGHGNFIELHGLMPDYPVEVESIAFQQVPEKFDFQVYKQVTMKEIALGIGLDIQDIWELTAGNMGTATQSEILHQKSKGKALGRILKGLERVINLVLPTAVEFEFQYRDPDEDMQIVQREQVVIQNLLALDQMGKLTDDESRQYLANNIESVREVITDQSGEIIRLDDADPKAPGQLQPVQAPDRAPGESAVAGVDQAVRDDTETKEYTRTVSEFEQRFAQLVDRASSTPTTQFSLEMALRGQLQQAGQQIWIDGLTNAGVENPRLDSEAQVAIAGWRSQQNGFITSFAKRVIERGYTPEQAARKAQMWVNKSLNNLYHMALGVGAPGKLWMWVLSPLKKHCDTCMRLAGQIHTMKEYLESGLVPQSQALECGGYNCGCSLVEAADLQPRGRLPSPQRRGLANLVGGLARLFSGLFGG